MARLRVKILRCGSGIRDGDSSDPDPQQWFIKHIYSFAEASLHFFIACCSEEKTSLVWRAEIRTRACRTVQQASALPTEIRCTLLSYVARWYESLLCSFLLCFLLWSLSSSKKRAFWGG
jgi:hypothetical protein